MGVRNQKGKIVDNYKQCETYSMNKVRLFHDGTYITAAKRERILIAPLVSSNSSDNDFNNIILVTVASSTTLPQSNSIHGQSYFHFCTTCSWRYWHSFNTPFPSYSCRKWVGGWLLFNANSVIFQLFHGENKLIYNEMMMRSALF